MLINCDTKCSIVSTANCDTKYMIAKPKMGRPKLAKNKARGKFVSTRVSPPEYKEIEAAADKSGAAKTEWVRNALLSAARSTSGG